jgi:hypothetical protein
MTGEQLRWENKKCEDNPRTLLFGRKRSACLAVRRKRRLVAG